MKYWFPIWMICCSAFAQNVNITNLPSVSLGFAPTDSLLGVTNGHAALYPASSFAANGGLINGNGAGLTNLLSTAAHAISNYSGIGTNTAFTTTLNGVGIVTNGYWQFEDGGLNFGATGQPWLVFHSHTNARIWFSGEGDNGGGGMYWNRNHDNQSGASPQLAFTSAGGMAFGWALDSQPGGSWAQNRSLQIGTGGNHHSYAYWLAEGIPFGAVNGIFCSLPMQFACYFTNDNSGNIYQVGRGSGTVVFNNGVMPTVLAVPTDIKGKAKIAFYDYFDNSVSGIDWNLSNSRERGGFQIGTNYDTGGSYIYGHMQSTNWSDLDPAFGGTGNKFFDYDGTFLNFYQPTFGRNARFRVQNAGTTAVFDILPASNIIKVGEPSNPCEIQGETSAGGGVVHFHFGPNGNVIKTLTVSSGGTIVVPGQTLDVIGTMGVSSTAYFTNLTASRVVLTDAGKALSSAAASGAVPMNADGSATTGNQLRGFITNHIVGKSYALIAQNTTSFWAPQGGAVTNVISSDTDMQTRQAIGTGFQVVGIWVKASQAAGAGQNYTITVMTNGVATALAPAISGASATTASQFTSIPIVEAQGDSIGIKIVTSATAATNTRFDWDVMFINQ